MRLAALNSYQVPVGLSKTEDNMWKQIILAIGGVVAIVGTVFAMSDNFINQATFAEFKQHVLYRLDSIDNKLDKLIEQR